MSYSSKPRSIDEDYVMVPPPRLARAGFCPARPGDGSCAQRQVELEASSSMTSHSTLQDRLSAVELQAQSAPAVAKKDQELADIEELVMERRKRAQELLEAGSELGPTCLSHMHRMRLLELGDDDEAPEDEAPRKKRALEAFVQSFDLFSKGFLGASDYAEMVNVVAEYVSNEYAALSCKLYKLDGSGGLELKDDRKRLVRSFVVECMLLEHGTISQDAAVQGVEKAINDIEGKAGVHEKMMRLASKTSSQATTSS